MRATVLCLLAIAGATCATFQLPGLPPLIPGLGGNNNQQSSTNAPSGSTADAAGQLVDALIQDIQSAVQIAASSGGLPLEIGSKVVNSITTTIENWLENVVKITAANGQNTAELAAELAGRVIDDIRQGIATAGLDLLQPAKLTADLAEKVSSDISDWLQSIQDSQKASSQQPGQQSTSPSSSPSSLRPRPSRQSTPSTTTADSSSNED